MILRSLRLSHVRCFRNPVAVGPFGENINILYGPNEVGKSTLMEAAALAIFDRHTTTGRDIESFQPWGTSLSPEITLEFDSRGTRYRLEKTFLSGHRSLLSELSEGEWKPLDQGEAADRAVQSVMLGESPGRGRAKPEQWGTASLLWSLQRSGAPAGLLIPGVPEPVADRLREALGGVEIRSHATDILGRIDQLYGNIFTERRGEFRKDSTVVRLRGELEELRHGREDAGRQLDEVCAWAEELQHVRRDLARLEQERIEALAKLEEYRSASTEVVKLREQLKLAEADEKACEKELREAQRTLDEYRKHRQRYESKREEWRTLDAQHKSKEDQIQVLAGQVARLRDSAKTEEGQLDELQDKLRRAQEVEKAIGLRQERASLTAQIGELKKLQARVSAGEDELESTPIPTQREVKKAEDLERACHGFQAQMKAVGLQVTVRSVKQQTLRFKGDARTQTRQLSAGEEAVFASGAAARLDLPGVARVDIQSGAAEIAQVEVQLQRTQGALKELLGRFGVPSAAQLAARAKWAEERRRSLADLESSLKERAAPYQDLAEITQQAARVTKELQSLVKDAGLNSAEALPAARPEDAARLASQIKALQKGLESTRAHLDEASQKDAAARCDLATIETARAVTESERDAAKQRAEELLGDARDDKELAYAIQHAQGSYQAAQGRAGSLRDRLPPPEADPEQLVKAANRALQNIEDTHGQLRDRAAVLEADLERAQPEGRYEKASVLEEQIGAKQAQLQRDVTQAIGLRLLREVVRSRRQATDSWALQGLEERVSRILSAVTDRAGRYIRLDSAFSVSGFSSDAQDSSVREVGSLSAGTQEQLWLSVRIALGETYAEKFGRQVMVLDDVLVYTDPHRHDRMLEVLRRAGERLQMFILTSHPSLYRGLTEAAYQFDVSRLRR